MHCIQWEMQVGDKKPVCAPWGSGVTWEVAMGRYGPAKEGGCRELVLPEALPACVAALMAVIASMGIYSCLGVLLSAG